MSSFFLMVGACAGVLGIVFLIRLISFMRDDRMEDR